MVFTEFLEMAESQFGDDAVDDLLDQTELESGGVYTAVGYYSATELGTLVSGLSCQQGVCPHHLVTDFGGHLFDKFKAGYPDFFTGVDSLFDFLEQVETVIHVEVRKLYPDAELPRFESRRENDCLIFDYFSPRGLGDLAEGLIRSAIEHFGESVDVDRLDIAPAPAAHTRFTLTPRS
ncbi:MAG: heme NO-binding domain-containing protein [Pseudomonadota bacterium]